MHYLKKYNKTLLLVLLITILSLMNTSDIPSVPLFKIPYFDKLVHFTMYFTLTFIFILEYYIHHKARVKRLSKIIFLPLFWGAVMELAQMTLTNYRGGDWKDMLANSVGVVIAYVLAKQMRNLIFLQKIVLFPFKQKY